MIGSHRRSDVTLTLSLACGPFDRTLPLLDGTVLPDGIRLNGIALTPGEMFRRQARHAEFDVCEFSLSTHTMLLGQDDDRFVALPAFPSRFFRHRNIWINVHAGINRPQDLVGRKVGASEYQQTASVWARGMLRDEYGVRAEQVEWHFGAFNQPGRFEERAPVDLPAWLPQHQIPEATCLDRMLEAGELDAIIAAASPASFRRHSPNVVRLFPDYAAVEQDYFRRTGLFPIMHTMVVKRSLLNREPWVADSLYAALLEAKRVGMARVAADGPASRSLPWFLDQVERTEALMGPDPYPYGFAANRGTIETFLRMHHEQGLTPTRLRPEDLFVEALQGT
jgi:4,5-dihydroxyphthalate decarboxylase